jgi:hypothetical protein
LQQVIVELLDCVFRVRNVLRMEMFSQLLYFAAAIVLQERLQQDEEIHNCESNDTPVTPMSLTSQGFFRERKELPKMTLEEAVRHSHEVFKRAAEERIHDTMSLEEFHAAMLQVEWRIRNGKLELPPDPEETQTSQGGAEIVGSERALTHNIDTQPAPKLDGVTASAGTGMPEGGLLLPCSSPRSTSEPGETKPSNDSSSMGTDAVARVEAHVATPICAKPPLASAEVQLSSGNDSPRSDPAASLRKRTFGQPLSEPADLDQEIAYWKRRATALDHRITSHLANRRGYNSSAITKPSAMAATPPTAATW